MPGDANSSISETNINQGTMSFMGLDFRVFFDVPKTNRLFLNLAIFLLSHSRIDYITCPQFSHATGIAFFVPLTAFKGYKKVTATV